MPRLSDIFAGLDSVYDHDLIEASDYSIFEWARQHQYTAIISADRDFVRLVEERGPPPKVIRIERCDFPARILEEAIRREAVRIQDFLTSARNVFLLKR